MGNPTQRNTYTPPCGVERGDRLDHLLAVGRESLTTDILMTCAIEDILDNQPVIWVAADSSARRLLEFIPRARVKDTIFFSPGSPEDRAWPVAWNPLKATPPDERFEVAAAVTSAFGSIYRDAWGAQSAHFLRTAVYANLDLGQGTLLGCLTMLQSSAYRKRVRASITDQTVLGWWRTFEAWPEQQQRAATAPLLNKLGELLTSWPLRNVVGQVRNKLDIAGCLAGQVLVVELSETHLGSKEAVRLFGSLLLSEMLRGSRRAGLALPTCFVYLNDAAVFAAEVIEAMVGTADAPLSVALATTHLDRLAPELEKTLMTRAGALLASPRSYADAETFYKQFGDVRMKERDFVGLLWNELGVKLEYGTPGWSLFQEMPHEQFRQWGNGAAILNRSRNQYGTPRRRVERNIRAWQRQWLEPELSPAPARGRKRNIRR